MKFRKPVLVLACGLALMMSFQLSAQSAHDGHEAHDSAAAAIPVPAQRWTPDAPLSEGMQRVRTAVDELRHYEMGHMTAPMAVERATSVEQAITYMFSHCKLAAEPDAALHSILVPLLGAAQALKANPEGLKAVADMRAQVARYPQYFNDPGWKLATPATGETHESH